MAKKEEFQVDWHELWSTRARVDAIDWKGIIELKEKDKLRHHWEDEGIRVEKARWGRHNILKGKIKIELPKTIDVSKFTLEEVLDIIDKKTPKKKAVKKK